MRHRHRHYITLAVNVALNPNTTDQILPKTSLNIARNYRKAPNCREKHARGCYYPLFSFKKEPYLCRKTPLTILHLLWHSWLFAE